MGGLGGASLLLRVWTKSMSSIIWARGLGGLGSGGVS